MSPGPANAPSSHAVVNPISNAPKIGIELDSIPNGYQFAIYRLRERITELEECVTDKDDRLRRALAMLEDELLFWRTGLLDHVWETMGAIQRRVCRLEAALAFIKDIQPHIIPKLEIPAR